MEIIVPIIIVGIIVLQFWFFYQNSQRMHEFRDIFSEKSSWNISRNPETGFVNGILGDGNSIFQDIRTSINKYLNSSSGSVIDYNLLKDAVDRHCDSVENDISTQTPVPLYCGLAGTMLGVIIGLSSLLYTGSISSLLGASDIKDKSITEVVVSQQTGVQSEADTQSSEEVQAKQEAQNQAAAEGVNDLLIGVAWAMIASICGISLTTISSLRFKKNKLEEESGKNEFLAWMQSVLLPELPSDTSDALNKLVKNLNRFNNTFRENTAGLGETLSKVNESYQIQAEIIQAVHDMDVMKMAKANVKVLEKLQGCTDELAQFQTYLESINGYTAEIQRFTELFHSETDRLRVLEEIRDFFCRHKLEIAKEVTDEDAALKTALRTLKDTSTQNMTELQHVLTTQVDQFREANRQLLETLTQQLDSFPQLYQRIDDISKIPPALEKLTKDIQKSNTELAKQMQKGNDSLVRQMQAKVDTMQQLATRQYSGSNIPAIRTSIPKSLKILLWIVGIVVIAACIILSSISILNFRHEMQFVPQAEEIVNDSTDTMFTEPEDTMSSINSTLPAGSNSPTPSTVNSKH